jgi:LacI family transcriptional regulator
MIHGHKHSWIAADNARGIKEALDHLLLLGHRRIALMHGNLKWRSPKEHLIAFKEHLAEGAVHLPPDYIITCDDGNLTHSNGYKMAGQLMALPAPPTAIVCGNDWSAVGVMTKLTELNLRVPKNVSIISCAQTQLSIEHAITMTAISRDYDQHLRYAVGMLMSLIQNPGRVLHERVENPLVKRQSTGPVKQHDQPAQSNWN